MSTHTVHGFVVESALALDAARAEGGKRAELVIRRRTGPLAEPIAGSSTVALREQSASRYVAWRTERGVHLRFSDVCELLVHPGLSTIAVTIAPQCPEELAALLVAGNGLSLWLGLQGHAAIHACALQKDGSAIAIAGASGSGKSTVSALLLARGWQLLAEDTVRVEAASGGARCYAGCQSLRLRPGTSALAAQLPEWQRETTSDGRLRLRGKVVSTTEPTALQAVFWLRSRRERPAVERLGGAEAVLALLRQSRLSGWCDGTVLGSITSRLAAVARGVPVFALDLGPQPPVDAHRAAELASLIALSLNHGTENSGDAA